MFQLCQNQMSQTGLVGRILFLFQSKIYRQRSYRLPYSCFNIFLTQQKCHSLQQPKNKNACIIPNKHLNIFPSTKMLRLLKSFSTVKKYVVFDLFPFYLVSCIFSWKPSMEYYRLFISRKKEKKDLFSFINLFNTKRK